MIHFYIQEETIMTKLNLNKKDLVSINIGTIGGVSAGFAAYVAALVPITMAEASGMNKGLIRIAKFGALVGGVLLSSVAGERLMDMTDDILEDGITLGIKKISIDENGVEFDIDK